MCQFSSSFSALIGRERNKRVVEYRSIEDEKRKANGEFTSSPFLELRKVFPLAETPDYLAAGDFDADGHWDLVVAARASSSLYLLPGDGHGGFGQARNIELSGRVTAMV